MQREAINPWDWGLQWNMNQGEVVTGATRTLRCSGQVAVEPDPGSPFGIRVVAPGDMGGQIAAALANIDAVLQKAGMSKRDILHLQFFTTDMDLYLEHYGVYAEWIAGTGLNPPQTLLQVSRLFLPELLIEIECTAGV